MTADDPSVLVYSRTTSDETYVMALGMDEEDAHTTTVADANLPGDAQLLFGAGSLTRAGTAAKITIPAAGMAIFRVR